MCHTCGSGDPAPGPSCSPSLTLCTHLPLAVLGHLRPLHLPLLLLLLLPVEVRGGLQALPGQFLMPMVQQAFEKQLVHYAVIS